MGLSDMKGSPGFDYNEIMREPLLPEGRTCDILGVKIAVTNLHTVIKQLTDHLEEYRGNYVCVTNVHTTVMAHDNKKYLAVQNGGIMAVPDGKPLRLICRRKGFAMASRVAGPDLMPALLKLSEEKGYRHFFFGGTEETLAKLKENLEAQFPKLQIAGTYSPPFKPLSEISKEEMQEVADRINATNPDFVWVGLGAPKQELWMARQKGKVNAVMLGVGAAFDFHAGTMRRAPKWMQEMYLEWLYRLIKDPKHLLGRYLKTNFRFIWLNIMGK